MKIKPQINGAITSSQTIKEFDIEQGFKAFVTGDLKYYEVMLKNGLWTYGPVRAEIRTVAAKLGGKSPDETKKLFAYSVKAAAVRELSQAVARAGMKQAAKREPVNG